MSLQITILLPVYNAEATLRECLDSILRQTYQDWTLLCANDGSTDESQSIIFEYAMHDSRITHHWFGGGNIGLSRTLNFGLEFCHTDWIARMDADDVMHPERLQRQVEYIEKNSNTMLLGTWGYRIDACCQQKQQVIQKPRYDFDTRAVLKRKINPFIHSSVMFRKDDVLKCGGYDVTYKYCPDFALWRKMAAMFPNRQMRNLANPLIGYRCHHAASLTARYPVRRFLEQVRTWWEYPL